MADEVKEIKAPMVQLTNHAPVTVGLVATSAIGLFLIVMKTEFAKDLYYTLPFLAPLATALGYLVKKKLGITDQEASQ